MKKNERLITHSFLGSALIALLTVGSLACSDAKAMAKRNPQLEPYPTPPLVVEPDDPEQQGFELGHRNGTLMVERLRERTVGLSGCSALDDFQRGLLAVSRTIRPPQASIGEPNGTDLGRGYFRGYLEATRIAIHDSRQGCHALTYDSGVFSGELYGTLLCQITKVDLSILSHLELVPLYPGWTGGTSEVISQCHTQAQVVLSQCGTDLSNVQSQVELIVQNSCHD